MEPQHEKRRLTTILAADVVGYSRLMAADESGTLAQLKAHRKELIDPKTAEYGGRVVKLMGDGTLMEFGSVVDAVLFAVEVQRAMIERNAAVPEDRQITYRVGINIGDIIVEGDDIYGDGVNVAARLQEMAEPGGVCVARNVFNQVKSKVDYQFEDLGEQALKNMPEPVRVFRVRLETNGGIGDIEVGTSPEAPQKIRFCRSTDGTRIAYATTGTGFPLVRVGHWLSHLELEWHNPDRRRLLNELGQTFAVTRYDQRSQGLSDWSVDDFSLGVFIDDLEAVVDAAGLGDFALYGASQGAPIGVAFAARHPDRVRSLILHGGYVSGRMRREAAGESEQGEALVTLMRHGWGKEGSPFMKAFTSMYMPSATQQQIQAWVELQKQTASPENAVKLRIAVDNFDVTDLLDKVVSPTLVIHARNDGVQPLEQGRELAAGIANSEFVLLESHNHVILPNEPAWSELIEAIRNFVLANV